MNNQSVSDATKPPANTVKATRIQFTTPSFALVSAPSSGRRYRTWPKKRCDSSRNHPWPTFGSPDSDGDFVALLSYLSLKSHWRVPPFFLLYRASGDAVGISRGLARL